jgi:predicted HicB family RNase H-like nuclease
MEVTNMPTTKAQQRAVNKYIKNNYDRLNATIPAGQKAAVEAAAARRGISLNALVNALLMAETGQTEEQWKNPSK